MSELLVWRGRAERAEARVEAADKRVGELERSNKHNDAMAQKYFNAMQSAQEALAKAEVERDTGIVERDRLESENAALKATRHAYASEFPRNADGEVDVGSIHENIRGLKAENAALREELTKIRDLDFIPLYPEHPEEEMISIAGKALSASPPPAAERQVKVEATVADVIAYLENLIGAGTYKDCLSTAVRELRRRFASDTVLEEKEGG